MKVELKVKFILMKSNFEMHASLAMIVIFMSCSEIPHDNAKMLALPQPRYDKSRLYGKLLNVVKEFFAVFYLIDFIGISWTYKSCTLSEIAFLILRTSLGKQVI